MKNTIAWPHPEHGWSCYSAKPVLFFSRSLLILFFVFFSLQRHRPLRLVKCHVAVSRSENTSVIWRFWLGNTVIWSAAVNNRLLELSQQASKANKQTNIHRLRRGGIFDKEISRSRFQLHCGCFCIAHEFAAELGLGVNAFEQLWSNQIPNSRDLVWKPNSETAGRRRRRGRRKWWRIRNTIKCWV